MRALNVKHLLLSYLMLFLGGCNFDTQFPESKGENVAPTETRITQLHVAPAESRLPAELQEQLFTTATLNDGSTTDVTGDASISWSSSDESIATVDGTGRVTAVGAGLATMTATHTDADTGRVIKATAEIRVLSAVVSDLVISPATASSLPPTASQPIVTTSFVANATLSDGSMINLTNNPALNWRSGDAAIATVNNSVGSKGLATAVGLGTTTITVAGTLNGQDFTATADLTVAP